MSLTIFTNEQSFAFDGTETGNRHMGTRDRFDPLVRYDYPGKAAGCLQAARMLQTRTLSNAEATLFGPILDSDGQAIKPIRIARTSRMPDLQDLERGHDRHYLRGLEEAVVKSWARAEVGDDPFVSDFGNEADITPGTFDAARLAVGASYDAIDLILRSPEDCTSFALVWPPGHHAERDLAMGFCYLSNAALAALYARDHERQCRPGQPNRVVVIDIDHHRGNGTADVLANQDGTLLIDISYRSPYDESRQRYTDGEFDPVQDRYLNAANEYPYSRPDIDWALKPHPMVVAPNILSVEFEGNQAPDAILKRFIKEVLPTIHAFNPDVILWSVGLDSAMGDPIGGLGNLPSSFYAMLRGLRIAFPEARHGGLLEGGYDDLRWFTCLPPVLLALHESPFGELDRCRVFRKYRSQFTSTYLG